MLTSAFVSDEHAEITSNDSFGPTPERLSNVAAAPADIFAQADGRRRRTQLPA